MAPSTSASPPPAQARGRTLGSRTVKVVLVVSLLAVAAVVAFLSLRNDDESNNRVAIGQPKIVSAAELASYTRSAHRPVYWAGPAAAGFKIELTEVRGRRTFVRYIPAAAKAGDPRPSFTTVATYPLAGAYARTRKARSRPGAVLRQSASGAAVLYYRKAPSNVYVAYPNVDSLIEVFAPQPRAAQHLARSQMIAPVR